MTGGTTRSRPAAVTWSHRPLTPEVPREEDADAGINMAARGAGAVLVRAAVVLGLGLLWAGPAGARVHHLTLKVRSAPPPSLWVRPRPRCAPCGAAEGAVRRLGPGQLTRAGVPASLVSCPASPGVSPSSQLSGFLPAWASWCSHFAVFTPCPFSTIPAFFHLFLSRGESV